MVKLTQFCIRGNEYVMYHPFSIIAGDYKTFQVIKSGQEARGDVKTPEGRYEGLIPVLSEFHISMELLKIIFHLTYDTGKYPLYHQSQ